MLYSDIEFSKSAFRHRIDEADIRRALADWIYEDQIDLANHEDKHLLLASILKAGCWKSFTMSLMSILLMFSMQ